MTKDFAAAFREFLGTKGISQSEAARQLDVSPAYVSNIANGGKLVSSSKVDQIADCLGLVDTERLRLHRAAARDHGFKISLPDDF